MSRKELNQRAGFRVRRPVIVAYIDPDEVDPCLVCEIHDRFPRKECETCGLEETRQIYDSRQEIKVKV